MASSPPPLAWESAQSSLGEKVLSKEGKQALKMLRERKDQVVIKSDKGNSTVILEKAKFNQKIYAILNNSNYRTLKKTLPIPSTRR